MASTRSAMLVTATLASVLLFQPLASMAYPGKAEPIGPCDSSAPSTQSASYVNDPDPIQGNGTSFMGAFTCYATNMCSFEVTETHTVGTTVTVDTGFGIDIGEVLSAGVDVSVSYSVSNEYSEGQSSTCANGEYTCGVQLYPQVAFITGTQTVTNYDACGGSTPGEGGGTYAMNSPLTDGEGNGNVYVSVCACPNLPGGDTAPIDVCPEDCP